MSIALRLFRLSRLTFRVRLFKLCFQGTRRKRDRYSDRRIFLSIYRSISLIVWIVCFQSIQTIRLTFLYVCNYFSFYLSPRFLPFLRFFRMGVRL